MSGQTDGYVNHYFKQNLNFTSMTSTLMWMWMRMWNAYEWMSEYSTLTRYSPFNFKLSAYRFDSYSSRISSEVILRSVQFWCFHIFQSISEAWFRIVIYVAWNCNLVESQQYLDDTGPQTTLSHVSRKTFLMSYWNMITTTILFLAQPLYDSATKFIAKTILLVFYITKIKI